MTIYGAGHPSGTAPSGRRRVTYRVIGEAILSLATPERSAEAILSAPTLEEWNDVARQMARHPRPDADDESVFDGECVSWMLLTGICQGAADYWRPEA